MPLLMKILLLNLLSIFYTIPKLGFIALFKKRYINLVFSSKKSIRRKNFYRVNLNFDADLIWNPIIPLPFIKKKVNTIYSIHFLDKLSLNLIESHIKCSIEYLQTENGKYFLSVKDSSPYINAYSNKKFSLYSQLSEKNIQEGYGLIDQINNIYREGNKTLFDDDFVKNLFLENGFKNIISREFDFNFDIPQTFYDSIYLTAF